MFRHNLIVVLIITIVVGFIYYATIQKDANGEEKNLLKEQLEFTRAKLDELNNIQPKQEGSSGPAGRPDAD